MNNKSDHEPIYCILSIRNGIQIKANQQESIIRKPRPSWVKSTQGQKDKFKCDLSSNLENVQVPLNVSTCSNLKCQQDAHKEETDQFVIDTLESIEKAAESCIPQFHLPHGRKKPSIPGWNIHVKPFRDNAAFWFSVWKSAGRPLNTELHKIMKRTRNLYHFQFKKCRKSEDLIKRSNFLNSCINGSSDIFSEIKKLRKCDNVVATNIDGESENIEEHLAVIYSNL